MKWEDDFRFYLKGLDEKKPVVMCGDLNVAHKEIDLKNPKTNRHNAGFTDEERGKFTEFLRRVYRYFPVFLSGRNRDLFLVVLSVQSKREERRMAY